VHKKNPVKLYLHSVIVDLDKTRNLLNCTIFSLPDAQPFMSNSQDFLQSQLEASVVVVTLPPCVDLKGLEIWAAIIVPGPPQSIPCTGVERFLGLVQLCVEDADLPNQKCSRFGIAGVNNPHYHSMGGPVELVHMADSLRGFQSS
jgi:hypothetical protein